MFHLNVKDKQNKFSLILSYLYNYLILAPISLIFLINNLLNIAINYEKIFNLINISCLIILITSSTITYLIKFIMGFRWRKLMMEEFLDIVNTTKLPKKLPKVLYIYTTKNDFMASRFLQNIQQTYQNIEIWISVGDPNDKNIKEIKEIVKKYNVNLYVMKNSSTSKSNNLNSFLKNNNVNYDYLLIGDSDVAFENTFVENSIKLFYSNRSKNLGYVSATMINYRGNNAFTNAILGLDNEAYVMKHQVKNYLLNESPNLYSACCLISEKMLKELNYSFPDSNLEDWYLEKWANKNFWAGVVSPLNISLQSFDKNIYKNIDRLSRLFTWGIKYQKNEAFKSYSVRYYKSNNKEFINVFLGVFFILGFIASSLIIWLIVINFHTLINNPINLFPFATILSLFLNGVITLIFKSYFLKNISQKDGVKRILLIPFYGIVIITNLFKSWIDSFLFSKYKTFNKNEKMKKNNLLLKSLWFVSFLVILFISDFLFFWFKIHEINEGFLYLVILSNLIIGYIVLYYLSFIILVIAGHIRSNKQYDENKFIYCENDFILQTKVKNEYYKKLKK